MGLPVGLLLPSLELRHVFQPLRDPRDLSAERIQVMDLHDVARRRRHRHEPSLDRLGYSRDLRLFEVASEAECPFCGEHQLGDRRVDEGLERRLSTRLRLAKRLTHELVPVRVCVEPKHLEQRASLRGEVFGDL